MRSLGLIKKAINLRRKGKTYFEIQTVLKQRIPKSTLSFWFRNLQMSAEYKNKIKQANLLNLDKARKLALKNLILKRKEYYKELSNRNKDILEDIDIKTQKLILSIIYLAEGGKYKSSKFMTLANSDPTIIKLFINLLKNCFNISKNKFRIRIQIRADQNKDLIENYWQKITKIKKMQFYPTYVDKRTEKSKTKKIDYKGVCTVYYFNTDIQLELEFLAKNVIKFINSGARGIPVTHFHGMEE